MRGALPLAILLVSCSAPRQAPPATATSATSAATRPVDRTPASRPAPARARPPARIETSLHPGQAFRTDVPPYQLYYRPFFGSGQLRLAQAVELRAEPSERAPVSGRLEATRASGPPVAVHEWTFVTTTTGRVRAARRRELVVFAYGRATGVFNGQGGRHTHVPTPDGAVSAALVLKPGQEVELLTDDERLIRLRDGQVYLVASCGAYQGTCAWHRKTATHNAFDGAFELLSRPAVKPWLRVSGAGARGWIPLGHAAMRWKVVPLCGTR